MAQSKPGQTDYVSVGWVTGLHGTSGQVRVRIHSDDPHRFDPGQILYCNGSPLTIQSSNANRATQLILSFEGVNSVAAARPLIGQWLTVPTDKISELPEGEYFHFQLLGLRVLTDEGEELGEVAEVIETGSNDVYVVNGPSGQLLLPAIASVVREVKLEEGIMVVHLLQGMR